ncbi:PREDICTED: islet cell autoantigen 1 [Rhagoletis zephyria]|uniref:islet cell autoantigen 1 n=1 Tax=Rhagoletis zephyria TaxID=28612 RepID=UPI000811645C|nr:PREDICTED: islet cell autoantigen 1 [Rhagoletis zephyria]
MTAAQIAKFHIDDDKGDFLCKKKSTTMLHHQFWITKKTVQRKLGSKEDEYIISSDADLDAKIEVFKSIASTSFELGKIIDQLQERLCILSQEECVFGRFLKEVGKRSKTTGQSITNTGKAVSYSGQQRMCVRVPLLRLHHEVEVFRSRAVRDTQATLQAMEKERTEYRAALSWMKSASTELDPDTGKGLDKFRTAQTHVRAAKQNFDSISMDSIQKIDLLAAARCNMYSHALVSYMSELKEFAQKTASTFETISKTLQQKPRYDFCVLKELTQNEGEVDEEKIDEIVALDKDQSLFFESEYSDEKDKKMHVQDAKIDILETALANDNTLIELTSNVDDELIISSEPPAQPNQSIWSGLWPLGQVLGSSNNTNKSKTSESTIVPTAQSLNTAENATTEFTKTTKSTNWMDLFAELDPLANPEAFDLKLSGGRLNAQQI